MKDTVAYTIEKGKPTLKTIAATAGNVATTLTGGSGYKIKILYGRIALTTDATVADRYLRFYITDSAGTTFYCALIEGVKQVASNTYYMSLIPNAEYMASLCLPIDASTACCRGWEIYDTDKLYIDVSGGVAGDSYTGYIKYLLIKR